MARCIPRSFSCAPLLFEGNQTLECHWEPEMDLVCVERDATRASPPFLPAGPKAGLGARPHLPIVTLMTFLTPTPPLLWQTPCFAPWPTPPSAGRTPSSCWRPCSSTATRASLTPEPTPSGAAGQPAAFPRQPHRSSSEATSGWKGGQRRPDYNVLLIASLLVVAPIFPGGHQWLLNFVARHTWRAVTWWCVWRGLDVEFYGDVGALSALEAADMDDFQGWRGNFFCRACGVGLFTDLGIRAFSSPPEPLS